MISCFIAGTDTGVGKTAVTLGLMELLKVKGLRVAGMKPVASGCQETKHGMRNADALSIQRSCNTEVAYNIVNPYAFFAPVSPYTAALQAGTCIQLDNIITSFRDLSGMSDAVIVEGIGGWRMPLAEDLQMSDLVRELQLAVILVVGFRLGCINHALLSVESIRLDGIKLLGWFGNQIDPDYLEMEMAVELLKKKISAPMLGLAPYASNPDSKQMSSYFSPICIAELDKKASL